MEARRNERSPQKRRRRRVVMTMALKAVMTKAPPRTPPQTLPQRMMRKKNQLKRRKHQKRRKRNLHLRSVFLGNAREMMMMKQTARGMEQTMNSLQKKRREGQRFMRLDPEKELAKIKDPRLLDNTYEAAFGNDGWGAKASEILLKVRGKDFRHEKTKKKRGGYRGGLIDPGAVRSIQFPDSDDE
mmetsp:Transcript_15883/g.24817  ORF Transcript_15883/g.24817 Transcript_15883/m.24817 type:complete len:185 (+) Transcript_15883:835-1389(+)